MIVDAYRFRLHLFVVAIALVCMGAVSARADTLYQYSFQFDAVGSYAAADFSVDSTNILSFGDTASLYPTGSLDGWSPAGGIAVTEFTTGPIGFGNEAPANYSAPAGTVIGFEFYTNSPALGPGVYDTSFAGREINAIGGSSFEYTSGVLTVTQATAPTAEPTSFLLFGTALLGLAVLVRQRSRQQAASLVAQRS